jgi:hypothetical protein
MSDNSVPLVGNPSNGGRALTTGNGADPLTAMLLRAATDPNFDPAKFEVAVRFLTERETRQAHSAFNVAMADAATEMQQVPKDASNDYLHSRYATLPGMLSVIKPITAQKGLAFRFGTLPHPDPDWMTVTLILSLGDHEEVTALSGPILSGEGIRGGKTQMNNLQAVGGTVTYLSRYLLGMVFSLIQHMPDIADDNDGGDPTRKPRGSSPASRPPADVKPNIARGIARFPSLQTQLQKVTNTEQLETFKSNAKFLAFWDAQTKPDGLLIDDMLYARRLELEEAARTANEAAVAEARAKAEAARTATAPTDFVPDEEPPTTTTTTTTTATPRQSLAPLVARVRSCETAVALDSVIVAPEFSRPASLLTPEDSDQLQAEVKKRYAELESTA